MSNLRPSRPLAPLHPNPVAGMAPPPSRRLPLLLAAAVYVALGGLVWKAPLIFGSLRPPTPVMLPKTALLLLIDEGVPSHPVLPPLVPTEGGGGDGGTGPLLLPDQPVAQVPTSQNLEDVDQVPAALPLQPSPLVSPGGHGTGGNGKSAGTDGGSGGGTGGGVGTGNGAGKQAVVLSIEDLDFENFEKPDYPKLAQEAGIQGEVMLHLLVDGDGIPTKVWATGGSPLFIPNTLKTAMKWRFGALRKKKIPAPAEVEFLVRFRLER